jgi:F0F1-type ATP synthase membrane subunit b/b'
MEKLKQQIITLANEEAKQIVDSSKAEAEAESEEILQLKLLLVLCLSLKRT